MENMQNADIRLLRLYKQHYMDQYPYKLNTQYSCWGYYDGMDIELISDESKGCIEDIWNKSTFQQKNLCGCWSNQNIVIFRSKDGIEEDFWNGQDKFPFCGISFIRLSENKQWKKVSKLLEQIANKDFDRCRERGAKGIVYNTFDNADIVCLLYSNSMRQLEDTFEKIRESSPYIVYAHSIMGVSEQYLIDCDNRGNMLESWNGSCCFLGDEIVRTEIQLVTSGQQDILCQLKYALNNHQKKWKLKNYEGIKYYFHVGHKNIILNWEDTDVGSFLSLFLPGGPATHQNPVYCSSRFFNIETSLRMQEKLWKDISEMMPERNRTYIHSKFFEMIKKCEKLMNECDREYEKAYLQVLIQMLNNISQYERFEASKEIFCLIYPAFEMFLKQMEMALSCQTSYDIDKFKRAMYEFIQAVESVVYHTIHTDQIYLMIPGYSGSIFSSPIKLCLFYNYQIMLLISFLNDNSENDEYKYIIIPEMESRPETSYIDFGLEKRDRLISIRLSQRTIYDPSKLLLIIAHEIGHYVGYHLRNRYKRLECLVKTMAHCIAEMILPFGFEYEIIKEGNLELFHRIFERIRSDLIQTSYDFLKMKMKNKCYSEEKYYAEIVEGELYNSCLKLLSADNAYLARIIKEGNFNEIEELSKNDNLLKIYGQACNDMDKRRRTAAVSDEILDIVKLLVKLYREVYSDVVAVLIYGCSLDDFKRVFCVSEGMEINEENMPEEQRLRQYIIEHILADSFEAKVSGREKSNENTCKQEWLKIPVKEKIYRYAWVQEQVMVYARECCRQFKERFEVPALSDMIKQLREVYEFFTTKEGILNDEFYDMIMESNWKYMDQII